MCAFAAHFIKEVSRAQLCSASKTILPREQRRMLNLAVKQKFMKPLAAELKKYIVSIRPLSNLKNLSRDDVTKVGTF